MDLDDEWADQAFVPSDSIHTSEPQAKRRATATEEVPAVIPGVTMEAIGLGNKDSILRAGSFADVLNEIYTKPMNFKKVKLLSFDGKLWLCRVQEGPLAGKDLPLPPLDLRGHGGTVP